MRFVIVGAGRVGRRTARVLTQEGHDVTVVEYDSGRAERSPDEEFEIVEGDGSSESDLVAVGIEEADGLAALSGDVTVNLVACMVGKAYGCRTVLRVDNDYREYILSKYASDVDEVIYPERLGAIAAKNALMGGTVRAIADVAQNIQLVELTVTEESPMRGYTLSELELPADSKLLGFGKRGQSVGLPDSDASLELGDRVVVIADFEALSDVRQIIVGQSATAATA
ncbi:potassium channel family protein [Halomarina oriensis]|uniref:TrkA family potassium uptake protein n=1 Tax=Halomarina oriensis TaxID=671145 RepID=A0A6B0GJQ5_9EURY|nr:TrkA family potassium uptake protein [Halomarina oriensis]MWG34067.1 TrkA family potassium uptake protein [Halomarina oriensis]